MRYPIYTPDICEYTGSLQKCVRDGWISSQGEFIEKAREVVQRVVGTPYAVLVNNGKRNPSALQGNQVQVP